jgi:hypothetical protein
MGAGAGKRSAAGGGAALGSAEEGGVTEVSAAGG